jgi:hypothetical protein
MKEILTIKQGRARSTYFYIIQPVPGIEFSVNQEVHCVNPNTNQVISGTVSEFFWTFDWDEAPRGFLFGIYGVEPKLLREALLLSDPEFKDSWARLILIREKG